MSENPGAIEAQIEPESDANSGSEDVVTPASSRKRKPFHYSAQDDINILKEVLIEKPGGSQGSARWKAVFDRLKLPVKDYRAIKRRFELLLKNFKEANWKSLRGSGEEEDYDEKLRLLTDILEQIDDWEKEEVPAVTKKRKAEDDQKRANAIRDAAVKGLSGTAVNPTTDDEESFVKERKRRRSSDVLDVVRDSEERDAKNKATMLELEGKRLDIMERELKLREDNERHNRTMDEKRLELEAKKLEMEDKRAQTALEQHSILLAIIQKKL